MEYKYTQNPSAAKPIILVDKYIGTDEAGNTGIDEGQFTREVLALKNSGVTEAEMWINSKGGLWSTSVGIVSAMNNSGINFTTINMGFADSSAGHIFQAGNKRVWMPHSLGLIHEIQGFGSDTVLEAMNASVATMLCGKTNKSAEEVRGMMKENTMMTAEMAKKYGFCDEIGKGNDILKFTNSSDAYNAGQTEIQKLLPKNKSMEAVNQLLGLANEASEAAQLAAIKNIVDAKNAAEELAKTQAAEILTLTNAKAEVDGKLLLAENAILEATNAAKQTAAEALVKEHVGKRIADTPENIAKWTNAAVADYDGTKALIEAINLNVTAPKAPQLGQRAAGAPVVNAHEYMMAPAKK